MRIALLTGTVGIGKSTTGYAVAERAASQGQSAAFLDVDELSRLWPVRVGDPFNTDLILRNLASIVGNYADSGADLLVLAWVVQNTEALVRPVVALSATDVYPAIRAQWASSVKRLRWSSVQATSRLDSSRVPSPTQALPRWAGFVNDLSSVPRELRLCSRRPAALHRTSCPGCRAATASATCSPTEFVG